LALHFGAVAVLSVITIAGLNWYFVMPAIKTWAGIQHQTMARSIAGQISAYLRGGERQLNILTDYLQDREKRVVPEPVRLLDAQCGRGEFFEAIFIVDNADITVKAVGLVPSDRWRRDDFMGLDLSGRTFIANGKGAIQAGWLETFPSTVSSRMAVALTVPLANGFIIGEIALDNLSAFVSHLPVQSEIRIMVIDGQGLIVADSQKRRRGEVLNLKLTPGEAFAGATRGADNVFELDGERMLGTLVPMDAVGWRVLVAQPIGRAFKPHRDMLVMIALGLGLALALAISISWFQAGKISRLFKMYADRAKSIADGRYGLHWPQARVKEYRQLGQSLQRMARKISRREKKLIENEERLKDFVANVPGVLCQFTVDPETHDAHSFTSVIRQNSAALLGLDSDPERYLDDFIACLPEEDRSRFIASIRQVVEAGTPWHYEGRFIKPSGEEIWIEANSVPRKVEDKIVFYGLLTDITRRKEMEFSLRLAQFIFDKAPIGIWRVGEDGQILDVNEQACASLDYSREELSSMTVFDIATMINRADWDKAAVQLKKHRIRTVEGFHQRKSGEIFPIQVISNLMRFEDQEFRVTFIQDITKRKQMEQALKESEERLDLALSGANEGIWDWWINEDILYLDSRYYTMAGYAPNEFPPAYDEILKRIHEDDLERVRSAHDQYLAGGLETFEMEFRFRRKDGSYMWIQAKGKIVADDQGNPTRFCGTHADITDRKQAEAALRENEQLLANILESMNEGVLVLGSDFKITIFNKILEKYTDTPRKVVLGARPWEAFPSIKNSPIEENMRKAMNGELAGSMEIRLSFHEKGHAWYRDSYSPLKDVDGRIVGIVGVVSDITQQKQNNKELRRLRNYLSNIIDSMPSIIVAVDREGKVTLWNHQTAQTTGISVLGARSRPLAEVFPRLADAAARIETSIRERRVISLPKVARKSNQETRFENITIFPVVGNGVEGAVIRIDDVTQQVRLEEMMIQSEKMLSVGGLAAGMAHEINNPLAGIMQNASVLKNRLTGDLPANHRAAEAAGTTMAAIRNYLALRKLPEMIGNIRTSGSLAAVIVRNMLSFARKSENVVSTNDIGRVLDQAIDLLKSDYDMKKHYDFKKIELVREYDQSVPHVPCDSSKIQQVFMNIMKNGAEAMAEMTTISAPPTFVLRVLDDGAWVRVEIEDNGPGIDEKTRRRVFEPFFTTKPVGTGTGLGLSVSYFIVTENHGGQMSVRATNSGGSCFVIRLPKSARRES
jgi:PAS domain S-box-containing protein